MINNEQELKQRQTWLSDFFLECRQVEGFEEAIRENRLNTYKKLYQRIKDEPKMYNQVLLAKLNREDNAQKWCFDVEETIKELEEYRDRNNIPKSED